MTDQITLAKAITDLGILVVIAAIFLGISVLVSKKILKDAAKDREKVDELNKTIQAAQQKQIDGLSEEVHQIRKQMDRQMNAMVHIANRAVSGLERMQSCVDYCKTGRKGSPPNDPSDSDIEDIMTATEKAQNPEIKTETITIVHAKPSQEHA